MEKVLGVIVEYNPFHNGHLYHIEKSKEATGCDFVVGIMSGNYVQRGEPAIINKWARAEIALQNGVDLVIELPTVYATQSAEGFSKGTVSLLAKTGVVTDLAFGSEAGDVKPLIDLAKKLLNLERDNLIKGKLKEGVSYAHALRELVGDSELLKGSNNILAVEYLKQILENKISFNISTIKRLNNNYNDLSLPEGNNFIASATSLRPQIKNQGNYYSYLPEHSYAVLKKALVIQNPGDLDAMSSFFFNLLIRNGSNDLKKLSRMEDGLENRIVNFASTSETISQLLEKVKSKRYPKSRMSRIFLHFMLNIDEELIQHSNQSAGKYLRVLGSTKKGLKLLKSIKANSDIPLSLNYNKLLNSFSPGSIERKQLELENRATNLYCNLFYKKYTPQLEFTKNTIIL